MSRYEKEWEKWGGRDPYFAVLTDDRFRGSNLDEESLEQFFDSGRAYVDFLLASVRDRFEPSFSPRRALDFGCGVGRLALPFAEAGADVLGIDVSRAMIEQASRNASQRAVTGVRFEHLDEFLAAPPEPFDLVNAYITFQHVPPGEGKVLLQRLIDSVREGGFAAIQLLHTRPAKWWKPLSDWARRSVPGANVLANVLLGSPPATPHMQMNSYDVNRFLDQLQSSGFGHAYLVFTDHGGYRGVLVVAQRSTRSVP